MQAFSRLVEPFKYHVFLCFRGKDTRRTITGDLYRDLDDRGFRVFMDQQINKGNKISQELPKAIEESRIYIIVLSENFTSSSYCLDEVVKILVEFAKGKGRWIVPVFFYVDPSDLVRTYEHALPDLKKWFSDEKIEEWRTALTELCKFHGFHVNRNGSNFKFEHQLRDEIAKEVSRHVICPIGLNERIYNVNLLLSSGSDAVRMIGICGKAGIGKTTLAHEVFHYNADKGFDHCLLSYGVEGISYQSEMLILNGKRVFIIFQDIKHFKQLEDIRKLTKQLGSGSIVIITAQDKHLFDRYGIGFGSIYEIKSFSDSEADRLLLLKFRNSGIISHEHLNIVNRIKSYARGHPWTLEVICSNLSGKSVEECESALLKYESITDRDIQKILEVNFIALEKCQQQMLIHIALYLKELKLIDVEDELRNKYKVCPRIDIRKLLDQSLIKINDHGQVTLHTSTQEMIKEKLHVLR